MSQPYTVRQSTIMLTNDKATVCSACLSEDRLLEPMRNLAHLLYICNCTSLTVEDKVCWECKALLIKMQKFRVQAHFSTRVQKSRMNKKENVNYQCQSSLGVKLNTKYDAVFTHESNEIQDLNETFVKSEIKTEHNYVTIEIVKEQSLHIDRAPDMNTIVLKTETNISDDDDSERTLSDHDDYNSVDQTDEQIKYNDDSQILAKSMDKDEMIKLREKHKEKGWFKNSQFKCLHCVMFFSNETRLLEHMRQHSEDAGPYKCKICTLRFQEEDASITHYNSHFTYYECGECGFKHISLPHMYKHHNRNHDNMLHTCEYCNEQILSKKKLAHHILSTHKAREVCEVCKKTFLNTTNLKRHMLLHSGMPMMECGICHNKYRGEWGLKAHMKTHDTKIPDNAYCTECDRQYKTEAHYKAHLKYNKRHASNETLRFECAHCGMKFISKAYLLSHIERIHLKLGNYKCDMCDSAFNGSTTLKRHKQLKHEGKVAPRKHVCETCGKGFMTKAVLREHTNTHSGLRPYRCDICSDTFSFKAALYTHKKLVHLKRKKDTNYN